MIQLDGQSRLVIGFAPEATQPHVEKKPPMGLQIERGTVYLGAVAGEGYAVGDTFSLMGREFNIGRILPPHGTAEEDIAICLHLKDAQEVLDKPGKISEILAIGCKCKTANRVEEITEQLEAVLPEARVMEHRLQAIARDKQRQLVEQHHAQAMEDYRLQREQIAAKELAGRQQIIEQERDHRLNMMGLLSGVASVATPLVILVCAIWVGMLAWANVRERRAEIGLLRALGKGSASIAVLFLGKAILLGFVGGVLGCLLGYFVAAWLATDLLQVAPQDFTPSLVASVCAIVGTPLVAAMAGYLPTLSALNQDPAVVLTE
jgi:ABC-type lipoprotein release transport system permease subunit